MLARAWAVLAAAFLALSVYAAEPEEAFEGHDYTRVNAPRPVATGDKIEVLEFFWYRCPHCYQLEPGLQGWLKTLPKDAQIRRMPAVFREDWLPGAKLYHTLAQMGLVDRLHAKVFHAYHAEKLNLNDPAVLGTWIAGQGVDRKKFESIYNSFTTQSLANQGGQLAFAYDLRGVPAFIVDGKYHTSVSMTRSEKRLFEVLDQLIAKARAERGNSKKAAK
ncbi:MAG: thiol:disulfide interchange protein DsbA/DsbL [Gammaproteobacteria bacterium]